MNFRYYNQADPRWASRTLGRNRTFKQAGCAMTASAMFCSGVLDRELPPTELDGWLDHHHGYQGDALVWGKVIDFLKVNGGAFSNAELSYIDNSSLKTMHWRHPDACILRVKANPYHYVLLTKELKVLDPGHSANNNVDFASTGYRADRVTWYLPATVTLSLWDAQVVLKSLGYYTGRIDGIYGPRTREGIRLFQQATGLAQTGILDDVTTAKLLEYRK